MFMMGWHVAITLLVVVPSWVPTIVCTSLYGGKSVLRCHDVCFPFESVGLRKSTRVFAGTSPAMSIIWFASWISCPTGWFPSSRGTFSTSIAPVTVVNPLGGLLNVWPGVLGWIFDDCVPLVPFQGCQDGFPSNCARAASEF